MNDLSAVNTGCQ